MKQFTIPAFAAAILMAGATATLSADVKDNWGSN